jgi:ribonuclease inhibitor
MGRNDMKQITLDGNRLCDASSVHTYLKEMLDFPEYYGNNFDALYDCLTDLEEIEINILPPDEDGAIYQKFIRVLKAADRSSCSLKINLL